MFVGDAHQVVACLDGLWGGLCIGVATGGGDSVHDQESGFGDDFLVFGYHNLCV